MEIMNDCTNKKDCSSQTQGWLQTEKPRVQILIDWKHRLKEKKSCLPFPGFKRITSERSPFGSGGQVLYAECGSLKMSKMRLRKTLSLESSHRNAVQHAIHVKQLLTLIVLNPKLQGTGVMEKTTTTTKNKRTHNTSSKRKQFHPVKYLLYCKE